jgi:hypothetical protein
MALISPFVRGCDFADRTPRHYRQHHVPVAETKATRAQQPTALALPDRSAGARGSGRLIGAICAATILFAGRALAESAAPRALVQNVSVAELRNSVEELGAASVKTFNLHVPEDGILELDLLVHRGAGVTLHLISRVPGGWSRKVNEFRMYSEFTAVEATTIRKSAHLPRGEYYVTLLNSSASEPTSVRIFARLNTVSKKT